MSTDPAPVTLAGKSALTAGIVPFDSGDVHGVRAVSQRFFYPSFLREEDSLVMRVVVRETSVRNCCRWGRHEAWGTTTIEGWPGARRADGAPAWRAEVEADDGFIAGEYYVAVVRGCCDSEDAYTFIHLRTGRPVYVQSGYGGRLALMGDVGGAPRRVAAFHDTFTEIVVPESRGNANAIGVLQYGPFAGPARRYLVTGPEGMGRRFESLRFVFSQPDADFSPADARAGSRAAQYAVRLVLVGFRYDDRVVLTIPIAADMLDLAHADIPDGIRIEAVSGGR